MEREQLDVRFVDGQRVTTDAAMEVVRTVLTGKVNQELVAAINVHGNLAVGISGADAGTIVASQADVRLGRVGKVERVNSQLVEDLVASDFIPVLATVGIDEAGGFYNVNADVVAGHVAAAIGAHKVIFLTDVDGLYEDFSNKDSLVSRMTLAEAQELVAGGTLATGMIPKMRSCIYAMESGVHRAHIINGTTPHALLLELLTDKGIGTMIDQAKDAESLGPKPLGTFASRLAVNN